MDTTNGEKLKNKISKKRLQDKRIWGENPITSEPRIGTDRWRSGAVSGTQNEKRFQLNECGKCVLEHFALKISQRIQRTKPVWHWVLSVVGWKCIYQSSNRENINNGRARSHTHTGNCWWVIFCCCSFRICVLCKLLLPRAMCMRNYGVGVDGMRRKGVRHMRRTSPIELHRCTCCVGLTAKQVGSSDPQNYLVLLRDFQFGELVRLPRHAELYCAIIVFSTRTWFTVYYSIVFYEMLCCHLPPSF